MSERNSGYAKGIVEMARGEGELQRVEDELLAMSRAVEGGDLRSTLTDPQLPMEKKQAIVDDLIGGRASSLTVGLVQLLVGQGHVSELPEIARLVAEAASSARNKSLAEVRSAVALDEETVARLTSALSRATGREVDVKVVVDPSVVGGLVARVGDTVIDGSLAKSLETVRQAVRSN